MKRTLALLTALALLLCCAAAYAEAAAAETEAVWTTQLTARFATVEEGQKLMRERSLFHEQITENTMDFFL